MIRAGSIYQFVLTGFPSDKMVRLSDFTCTDMKGGNYLFFKEENNDAASFTLKNLSENVGQYWHSSRK